MLYVLHWSSYSCLYFFSGCSVLAKEHHRNRTELRLLFVIFLLILIFYWYYILNINYLFHVNSSSVLLLFFRGRQSHGDASQREGEGLLWAAGGGEDGQPGPDQARLQETRHEIPPGQGEFPGTKNMFKLWCADRTPAMRRRPRSSRSSARPTRCCQTPTRSGSTTFTERRAAWPSSAPSTWRTSGLWAGCSEPWLVRLAFPSPRRSHRRSSLLLNTSGRATLTCPALTFRLWRSSCTDSLSRVRTTFSQSLSVSSRSESSTALNINLLMLHCRGNFVTYTEANFMSDTRNCGETGSPLLQDNSHRVRSQGGTHHNLQVYGER